MPTVSVNLDRNVYVRVNTALNPLVLQALRDTVRITLSNDRPVKNNPVFHTLSGKDAPLHFPSLDTNVWALAVTDVSSLIVSETDRLPVVDLSVDLARGAVVGSSVFGGFGEIDAGIVADADVWLGPTTLQPFPPAAGIQMEVVSTSVADALGGTGIEKVEIHYLDANGDAQSEIVTLAGTTPVNTVATDIRFAQCLHVYQAGTAAAAVGNVSLRSTDAVSTYKYMPIDHTRCLSTTRMVPKGKTLFISSLLASAASGASKRATIRLMTNAIDGEVINSGDVFFPHCTASLQDNTVPVAPGIPVTFPELTIIRCLVTTTGACYVSANWSGWIEDN